LLFLIEVLELSDLEGLTRRLMEKGFSKEEIIVRLVNEYTDFKDIEKESAFSLAKAIYEECKKSDINSVLDPVARYLLEINMANVTVGKQGVGCRGSGDFFVHKLIAELSKTETKAYLSPTSLDDAGAVKISDVQGFETEDDLIIVSKMEGIHSRLSDFPFLCGFHVISRNKFA
jgi:hydrogenase expression/formation protein